ncbi:hypothetical protein MBLNU230_g6026t1 [Neophaeotheca triangularis]
MFGLSYWFLPLFAGLCWLGTLLGMLLSWVTDGKPIYDNMSAGQTIPYISTIGATYLQPLFIAGSAVCVVVFDLAFISERWLRHKGRLTQNYSNWEKVLSVLATIFAVIGAIGLILLTCFNTVDFPRVHDACLAIFIVGYIISAIFICAEYQRLGIHFRSERILRISFWIKLAFIIIEIALAIAFVTLGQQGNYTRAAVLEWLVSLLYIFYIWSFIIDFLPATRTKAKEHRYPPVRRGQDDMAMRTQHEGNMVGGPVYSAEGTHFGAAPGYDGSSGASGAPMNASAAGRYYQGNDVEAAQPGSQHLAPSRNF